MESITKPQQSSKNAGHQLTVERTWERRERQEGTLEINGRKLRQCSDQTTGAFSCPSSACTHAHGVRAALATSTGGGRHGVTQGTPGADTQPTGLPTLPSQPDSLFSFSPPGRHSLPLRGKTHPSILLPAPSHDDSPFRNELILV